ncbi:MAG: hypothetical protein R3B82_09135 [Sandaracinaceae bacterium]
MGNAKWGDEEAEGDETRVEEAPAEEGDGPPDCWSLSSSGDVTDPGLVAKLDALPSAGALRTADAAALAAASDTLDEPLPPHLAMPPAVIVGAPPIAAQTYAVMPKPLPIDDPLDKTVPDTPSPVGPAEPAPYDGFGARDEVPVVRLPEITPPVAAPPTPPPPPLRQPPSGVKLEPLLIGVVVVLGLFAFLVVALVVVLVVTGLF